FVPSSNIKVIYDIRQEAYLGLNLDKKKLNKLFYQFRISSLAQMFEAEAELEVLFGLQELFYQDIVYLVLLLKLFN
uniref:Uncharacterized protein n=1 Tax=Globisporangium ultimum (strain ATCC 200006 / CBS 805.95 / DAOM BR144) TaxID=431595 RepID=K3XCN5_GLOUD